MHISIQMNFRNYICVSSFVVDLVLYCEAFLTTYRTFITPEELIKKLHYRYPCLGLPLTRDLYLCRYDVHKLLLN